MKSIITAFLLSTVSAFGGITFQNLFTSGEDGYDTYRIPAVIVAPDESILAFCEGRAGRADHGRIDLLMRRSVDGGKTWSKTSVLWSDGSHTWGNPCPVVDGQTGRILLVCCWNHGEDTARQLEDGTGKDVRRIFYLSSDDHGVSWSRPVEITAQTKRKYWHWYATGPGIGIQLQHGSHKGRLVIPANHSIDRFASGHKYGAHVIYSDNGGISWEIGDSILPGLNESQVVELMDGTLMFNARNYLYRGMRALAFSEDGGESWPHRSFKSNLIEPRCQASIIRYAPNQVSDRNILLFSNPNHISERINMTVKLSYDEGKSWPVERQLHAGPSAYSCLVALPDGRIGCFYEAGGEVDPYENLVFAIFTLDWLTDDKDLTKEGFCEEFVE